MVLFPPPFYFVFYISNLLSYIQNNFSYELARPIMGTIFLVIIWCRYNTIFFFFNFVGNELVNFSGEYLAMDWQNDLKKDHYVKITQKDVLVSCAYILVYLHRDPI